MQLLQLCITESSYDCICHKDTIFVAASDEELPIPVIPQGIESVHGSAAEMGCSEVVTSHGREVCCPPSSSYLLDGSSSTSINTNSSNWASQLVIVKKNDGIPGHIEFPHVLLTFIFDRPVSPMSIEMDVFHCPDQNIGAQYIEVYANDDLESQFTISQASIAKSSHTPEQSCESLSPVIISVQAPNYHYFIWYLLMGFDNSQTTEWVYIGEVKFQGLSEHGFRTNKYSICPSLPSPLSSTIVPFPLVSPSPSSIPTHTKFNTYSSLPATHSLTSSVSLSALKPSVPPQETTTVSPPSSPRSHFGLIVTTTTLSFLVLTLVAVLLFIFAFRVKQKQHHMMK